MNIEIIEQDFEAGASLPLESITGVVVRSSTRVRYIYKSESDRICFFINKNSTYPDLEDEYCLYLNGEFLRVYYHWYAEHGSWNVKWYCSNKHVDANEHHINQVVYQLSLAIGFPNGNRELKTDLPLKIRDLVVYPDKNGKFN